MIGDRPDRPIDRQVAIYRRFVCPVFPNAGASRPQTRA